MRNTVGSTLWPFMKKHIHWVYLGAICSLLQAFFDVMRAILLERMLDTTFINNQNLIIKNIVFLVGIVIVGVFLSYIIKYAVYAFAYRFDNGLRNRLIHQLIHAPISQLEQFDRGELINRINGDTRVVKESFSLKLYEAIYMPIVFILSFGYLFTVNWKLTVISVVLMPVSTFLINRISKPITQLTANIQNNFGEIQSISTEVLAGIETIKSFHLFNFVRARYHDSIDKIYERERDVERKVAKILPLTILQRWGTYLICTVYSAYLATVGAITAGELLVFLILVNNLINPISTIPGIIVQFRTAFASGERMKEILTWPLEPRQDDHMRKPSLDVITNNAIELRQVRFGYEPNKDILTNLNLTIPRNQITAIVGASGSGKSTLFHLLCGFQQPQEGTITYFGELVNERNRLECRKLLSLVSQETYLFPGTILENVSACGREVTYSEVVEATEKAGVLKFVNQLPEGFHTRIGEGGLTLSGGQKQRIAITRALLKDAPILLFDEPTSALDYEVEASIQATITELAKEKTIVIIAHRMATIAGADQIVVLEKGSIQERGTHEQLIEDHGLYRQYYLSS